MSVDSSDSSIACSRKPTIVFVDDEPLLLESLRGNFRKFASQWDLHFIVGGPRALDALQELSVHVILTDLKMPEVHGCELMQHAMKHAP